MSKEIQKAENTSRKSKINSAQSEDITGFFTLALEFSPAELVTFNVVGKMITDGVASMKNADANALQYINSFLNEESKNDDIKGIEGMVAYRIHRATKMLKDKERFIPEKYRMKMLLLLIEIASDPASVKDSFVSKKASLP